MKKHVPSLLVIAIGILIAAGIMPGCDELVTREVTILDTLPNINNTFRDSFCVEYCHSDSIYIPQLAKLQWLNSRHSSRDLLVRDDNFGQHPLSCGMQCHTREGFVRSLTDSGGSAEYGFALDCYGCHQPHTTWDFSLRDTSILNLKGDIFAYGRANICARCHQSLADPAEMIADTTTTSQEWAANLLHGSAAADIFIGGGGYEYAGKIYENSHKDIVIGGCITCHQEVAVGITRGGHSYNIREDSLLLLTSCNTTACHNNDMNAANVDSYQNDSLPDALALLAGQLIGLGLISPIGNITLDTTIDNPKIAGALYNYFYAIQDRSQGLHNWKYVSQLLSTSIEYLNDSVLTGGGPPAL